MDGFAIRVGLGKSRKSYLVSNRRVVGRSVPGDDPGHLPRVRNDTAVEVLTGSPLPPGADTVLRIESTRRDGKRIWATNPIAAGHDVARKGEDFRPGDSIVSSEVRLRPWHVAALLANGVRRVQVYVRPRSAVLTTGSEIVDAKRRARSKGIRDTTKPLILGLLTELGLPSLDLGQAPDSEVSIREGVLRGLERCDLVITIGGSSMGRRDLVPRALSKLEGSKWIARHFRLRPGSTASVAMVRGRPVFALPGPPVAAFSAFLAIVEPFLRSYGDVANRGAKPISAILEHGIPHRRGVRELIRVKVERGHRTHRVVAMVRHGAALLSSLTDADGLLFLDERRGNYAAGEIVVVVPFGETN
jgi:molybdopterin molybdotransferase